MEKYTKAQVNKMTSEQYLHNFNTDPEFKAFVDGGMGAPEEDVRPAPRNTSSSLRGRAEAVNVPVEEKTFDPSFDDSPNAPAAEVVIVENGAVTPAVVVEPVAVMPSVSAELPEKIHEYQILDKEGRPRGGIQRFKYRTDAELIEHLTKAHKAASSRIWELVEEKVLSSTEAPANTTVARQLELRPLLQPEDRAAWEEKLQDPAESAHAQYVLDRDDDRRVTNDLVHQNFDNSIMLALESFKNRNRDYVPSQENAAKIIGYVDRRGLDPTDAKNYQKAYDVLRESGIIATTNQPAVPELVTEAPTVREEKTVPNTQAPVEATARISPEVPPQETRVAPVPTGLSNADSVSDEANPMPKPHWLTIREWLKDAQGKATSQYQEFHDLDAIDHLDDKTFKRLVSDQSPKGKDLRVKWDAAEAEKQARLADQRRKFGY